MKNTRRPRCVIAVVATALLASAGLSSACNSTARNTQSDLIAFSRIDKARAHSRGANVTVAVVDWQFDPHAEAAAKFVFPTSMVPGERMGDLKPWHGAWMVNIVHRIAPEARIIPIIGRSLKMPHYQEALVRGIRYAADHAAVAVSSSMGTVRLTQELQEAIDYAEERGTLFVDVHPENVAADPKKFQPCSPSECEPRIVRTGIVSVPAHPATPHPSRLVYTWPYDLDAHYEDGWGFSNAPPIVSGVIALMKSANPTLTPPRIRALLQQTADDQNGFRVLNAEAAVKAAMGAWHSRHNRWDPAPNWVSVTSSAL